MEQDGRGKENGGEGNGTEREKKGKWREGTGTVASPAMGQVSYMGHLCTCPPSTSNNFIFLVSDITNVGVARCSNWWCHPISSSKKWWHFLVIVLRSGHFSSGFLVNTVTKYFRLSLGCHPLDGVSRVGLPLPSDTTVLSSLWSISYSHNMQKSLCM